MSTFPSLVSMRIRWAVLATLAAALSIATLALVGPGSSIASPAAGSASHARGPHSALADLAASNPAKHVEVIVQLRSGTDPAQADALAGSVGGVVERQLPIVNGFSTTLRAAQAEKLSLNPAVHAVSLNAKVESEGVIDPNALATSYNASIRSPEVWKAGYTGEGIGVAVIDTGIQGNLPDFRESQTNASSRVIASVVTNPAATTADDTYGHGTHIAGLIAGNGANRPAGDPLYGRYAGVAPDANLIGIKASDDAGNASVLDVIDGLQFVIDHQADYNIRIVNLSLRSTVAESYVTDPLDAAVEAAWNSGVVVVVASGNNGNAADSVDYAPANDPFVITVGGADDQGTKKVNDDALASWSSRGITQDGFQKPDVVAPGAHLISTIPADSEYTSLCPSCVTDGEYFRVGGTSMAAAVTSGEAALLLQAHPELTPDQVKAQLVKRTRGVLKPANDEVTVNGQNERVPDDVMVENGEAAADKAVDNGQAKVKAVGMTPNVFLDPATGLIDYERASWSRASWSDAVDGLRASWSRASWSRAPQSCTEFERASWSRASWSRASWSRASWSRASWSADGMSTADLPDEELAALDAEIAAAQEQCSQLLASIDPARASWSRASWSRASWSSAFDK